MYPIGINSPIFASSGHLSKLFGKPDLTLWDIVFHTSQKWWEEPEVVGGARSGGRSQKVLVCSSFADFTVRAKYSQLFSGSVMSDCFASKTSRKTVCDLDCSRPSSSVRGISQARILEWVAVSFSRGPWRPRYQTCVSCIAGRLFTAEPPGKPQIVPGKS